MHRRTNLIPQINFSAQLDRQRLGVRLAAFQPLDLCLTAEVQTVRDPIDTKYAALYYPWIVVHDPLSKQDMRLAPSIIRHGIALAEQLDIATLEDRSWKLLDRRTR